MEKEANGKKEYSVPGRLLMALLTAAAFFLTFAVYDGGFISALAGDLTKEALMKAADCVLPFSFMRWAVFAAVTVCALYCPLRNITKTLLGLALLFGLFMLSGLGMTETGSFSILFSSPVITVISLFIYAITVISLLWLMDLIYRAYDWVIRNTSSRNFVFVDRLFERSSVIKIAAFFFAVWLPLIVLRYPAGIEKDAYYQINQFMGTLQLIDSNPPLSSLLIGGFVKLGSVLFGSVEIGAFLYVLFQAVCCSLVLAYSLKVMYSAGVNRFYIFAVMMIYAFIPIFSGYITSVIKDAPFAISAVLLISALSAVSCGEKDKRSLAFPIIISSALVSLLRHTGIMFVMMFLIVYLISAVMKKERRAFLISAYLACGIVIWAVFTPVLTYSLGMEHVESGAKEALSVPLQQTANFCRTYPDDVTAEERDVISRVLDYDKIVSSFDISLSDPVKATWHGSGEDVKDYARVWSAQLIRHPGCYADAFLGLNYGYFYPSVKQNNGVNSGMYKTVWNTEGVSFSVPAGLKPIREAIMGLTLIVENFPLFYPFCCVALYSWLMIFLLVKSIREKNKTMLRLVLPCFLWMVGCLNVPTFFQNGVRYALPYIWPSYLLAGLSLFTCKRRLE